MYLFTYTTTACLLACLNWVEAGGSSSAVSALRADRSSLFEDKKGLVSVMSLGLFLLGPWPLLYCWLLTGCLALAAWQ